MNKEIYPFYQAEDNSLYFFISKGIHGDIQKVVSISRIPDGSDYPSKSAYNLGWSAANNCLTLILSLIIMSMEKHTTQEHEAILEELLKDKDRIIEAVKNSPFLKKKNEKAAEDFAKLPRPFPWEKEKTEADS